VRVYLTGGTSGIGRACVERLREDGADVVFSGRNDARGKAVAKETGARFIRCDLTTGPPPTRPWTARSGGSAGSTRSC
jgi:NAD(P)-dependent dehydrogenase (short-subunit alcohol dehydrogenase family)